MRFLTQIGTRYLLRASSTNLYGTDPYALARFSRSTARLPFPSFASLMSCVITPICPKQPRMPAIPPFCTEVSK